MRFGQFLQDPPRHRLKRMMPLDRLKARHHGDDKGVLRDADFATQRRAIQPRAESRAVDAGENHRHPLDRHDRRVTEKASAYRPRTRRCPGELPEEGALPGLRLEPPTPDRPSHRNADAAGGRRD